MAVLFPDGEIRYGMYCGTNDVIWPRLFDSIDEAWNAYSNHGSRTSSMDDFIRTFYPPNGFDRTQGESVQIWIDYGGGSEHTGRATREFVTSEWDTCSDEFYENYEKRNYRLNEARPEWLKWKR